SPWGAPAPATAPVPPTGGVPPVGPPSWGTGAPTPPPLPTAGTGTPHRPNRALRTLVALLVVLGLFGGGFGLRSLLDDNRTTVINGASQTSIPAVTIDPRQEPVAAVALTVSPSVVRIDTDRGLGSGVIYDASGLVMTNAHVVGSATTVTVRTADGKSHSGQVLGADTGTDIAVVRVNGLGAPAATLADSKPIVGQMTVAVGSPFGLTQSVTSGIVSAVNRPVDNDKGVVVNMIQTDASINPGNSGGALADRAGQIIGINTAIFSQTGENNGIGFAIPIATAKKAADKLVAGESVAKAGLGLTGPTTTPNGASGAYVQSVTPGGAADQGGIRAGDLIVAVDDTPIHAFDELRGTISAYTPGDTVTVTIERDGQQSQVSVTLGTLGTR
ncbi:MAG: trypsin-like peptidase domain-containing protein, partial [Acidobacteria bacterium]|nr:trypsin-like peptidase domain-containing protein [Acidobacteriota bacterium]